MAENKRGRVIHSQGTNLCLDADDRAKFHWYASCSQQQKAGVESDTFWAVYHLHEAAKQTLSCWSVYGLIVINVKRTISCWRVVCWHCTWSRNQRISSSFLEFFLCVKGLKKSPGYHLFLHCTFILQTQNFKSELLAFLRHFQRWKILHLAAIMGTRVYEWYWDWCIYYAFV